MASTSRAAASRLSNRQLRPKAKAKPDEDIELVYVSRDNPRNVLVLDAERLVLIPATGFDNSKEFLRVEYADGSHERLRADKGYVFLDREPDQQIFDCSGPVPVVPLSRWPIRVRDPNELEAEQGPKGDSEEEQTWNVGWVLGRTPGSTVEAKVQLLGKGTKDVEITRETCGRTWQLMGHVDQQELHIVLQDLHVLEGVEVVHAKHKDNQHEFEHLSQWPEATRSYVADVQDTANLIANLGLAHMFPLGAGEQLHEKMTQSIKAASKKGTQVTCNVDSDNKTIWDKLPHAVVQSLTIESQHDVWMEVQHPGEVHEKPLRIRGVLLPTFQAAADGPFYCRIPTSYSTFDDNGSRVYTQWTDVLLSDLMIGLKKKFSYSPAKARKAFYGRLLKEVQRQQQRRQESGGSGSKKRKAGAP